MIKEENWEVIFWPLDYPSGKERMQKVWNRWPALGMVFPCLRAFALK